MVFSFILFDALFRIYYEPHEDIVMSWVGS